MKYDITDFGAKSDGELCTKQIQNAIDKCFLAGGGEVVVPRGKFLTGGIRLRSNVTLYLSHGAYLVGSIHPEDYCAYLEDEIEPIRKEDYEFVAPTAMPESHNSRSVKPYSRWNNAIIRAIYAKNIAIIGEKDSFINGQNCYDELGEEKYRGPHAINMWFCENIKLSGYTITDSGNWAHAIHNSKNIDVRGVTVFAGHDGFDIRTCDDVAVEDCVFHTGDDSIAGFDNINVTVRNCVLNSACSAFRFGGTDVLIENCTTVAPCKYGHRGGLTSEQKKQRAATDEKCRYNCLNAFLYYCDYRADIRKAPGNILVKNCKFTNVDSVFFHPFGAQWSKNRALNSITFEDCAFDGVSIPINIESPENERLTFKMKNCRIISKSETSDQAVLEAKNFENIIFENVELLAYDNPKFICCTEGNIEIINSTPVLVEKGENCSRMPV